MDRHAPTRGNSSIMRATQIPDLGVLFRLSTPSSIIKRIYYAKVLRQVNDVLFIRDRSFDIHSLGLEFKLQLVASQNNLDGIIRSSLILPEFVDLGLDGHNFKTKKQDDFVSFCLPRQILVLDLQGIESGIEPCRRLVFTFPYFDMARNVKFASFEHPLPDVGYKDMDTSMVVEPKFVSACHADEIKSGAAVLNAPKLDLFSSRYLMIFRGKVGCILCE